MAPKATFSVTLLGGEPVDYLKRYEPGADLDCTIRLIPHDDFRCEHIYVRLQWHTQGRGTRDEAIIAEQDVYHGELKAGVPHSYNVRFVLPGEPWSYTGVYVTIVWEVAVEVTLPLLRRLHHRQPLIMAPPGAQVPSRPPANVPG